MKILAADLKTLASMTVADINAALERNGYLDKYESAEFLGINSSGDVVYSATYIEAGESYTGKLYVSMSEVLGGPVAEY